MTRALRGGLALVLGLACVLFAAGAQAAIYKCTGPDGKTIYTGNRSQCPNAKPHVLKKKVQTVVDDGAVRRRRPGPAARRSGARDDGLERMWKSKRPAAERNLMEAEERLSKMQNVIRACNRGGEWYRIEESGIRTHISCEELRAKLSQVQQRRDDLVHYLAEGLEDECRRAGCQPGWVR
jgi:hypothetical protein